MSSSVIPSGSVDKESTCNAGDLGAIPGLGKSPGEGNGYPLQYSCLENPWIEETGWLQSLRGKKMDMPGWLTLSHFFFFFINDEDLY